MGRYLFLPMEEHRPRGLFLREIKENDEISFPGNTLCPGEVVRTRANTFGIYVTHRDNMDVFS